MSLATRHRARRRAHTRRRHLLMRVELALGMGLLPRPLERDEADFLRTTIDSVKQALREPTLRPEARP